MQVQNNIIEPINIFEVIDTDERELCSICLDEMVNPEGLYKIESCNHIFHTKCILEMFINGINDFCPLCRSYITTTNNTYNIDNFKFNLIKKYAHKKGANKIVVNLFKKYNNSESQLKLLVKQKHEINKNINLLKKNNKDIIKHNLENNKLEKRLAFFLKGRKNVIKVNSILVKDRRISRSPVFIKKIIRENVKNCNTEILRIFNEKIEEIKQNEKHECLKAYDNLIKMRRNIDCKRIKMRRKNNDIKRSILQIPIAAPVKI